MRYDPLNVVNRGWPTLPHFPFDRSSRLDDTTAVRQRRGSPFADSGFEAARLAPRAPPIFQLGIRSGRQVS
jgi:hypothetical protein